jgi:uncharacterized protein (DUF2141 family)
MSQDPTLVPQSTARPPRTRQLGRRPLLGFWAAALALGGLDRTAWATSEGAVGTLVVNVVGIGEHSGTVVALLFNHNDGFPAKVAKACQRTSAKVTGSMVTLRFTELPLGTYAVTVYHDVNDNQKLDTNWIGIPKEPVAVSNNAKGRLGPPKWKDATFELREATQELTVNLVKI